MTIAYLTEYAAVIHGVPGHASPIPLEPAIAEQTVSFTTSAQSAALHAETRFVRIVVDGAAHVKAGSNPTATTSHQPLAADVEHWRGVSRNNGTLFAFIDQAGA